MNNESIPARLGAVITHAEVIETALNESPSESGSARKSFKSCCKRWCTSLGVSVDDPADTTLGECFEQRMKEFVALVNTEGPGSPRAAKNVRSAACRMREAYRSMLASQDLPLDFNAAFRQCMDAKDLKPVDLNRMLKQKYHSDNRSWHGAQLWSFYEGTGRPGRSWRGDSRLLLAHTEEVLGLPPDALVSRAYPPDSPILRKQPSDIPYRVARSKQWDARYSLQQLPSRLQPIWNMFADWRTKQTVLVNGKVCGVSPRSIWARPGSKRRHTMGLLRYFGWLCLPAPSADATEPTQEERWRLGKGLHPDELQMAHLFDTALLWEYLEFLRFRQHNHQFTKAHLDLLMLANSFVSTSHCFLLGHPELAEEFGLTSAPFPAWEVEVEQIHQRILQMIRSLRKLVAIKQRSADEPLRHVLNTESPYTLFLELAARMERECEPPRALAQSWSTWARDVVVFKMHLEVPLRSQNFCDLRIGRHLTRDTETGLWHVFVSKSELKNHYSGHALDISRNYSADTSRAMDRYVDEGRCAMVGYGMTDVFLLGPAAGRRADTKRAAATDFKLSNDSLYRIVAKWLEKYFGESQGSNIFRHMIVTSILKDDPSAVEMAAAVLNSSPETIRRNYGHLTQEDGLRMSRAWFSEQLDRRRKPPKGSD
jgi:hypothetical protein